jgi:hypothetical protein
MPDVLSDVQRIRKTYVDPIRTVILIDDAFPMYGQLCDYVDAGPGVEQVASLGRELTPPSDPPAPLDQGVPAEAPATAPSTEPVSASRRWDAGRASALWKICRTQGWACDVDNGNSVSAAISHIDRSDLVVLDYHLNPGDTVDPSRAHEILDRIANGDHSTLVVVYTRDDRLALVRRQVAAHLRGAAELMTSSSKRKETLGTSWWIGSLRYPKPCSTLSSRETEGHGEATLN